MSHSVRQPLCPPVQRGWSNPRTNRCQQQRRRSWRLLSRGKPKGNMKQQIAVEQFLAGRRVVIAKFVAHRHKEVQNKAKKPVGVVNLYEVQCADGKAPTVQTWCPRSVQTVEQAAKECLCQFKDGQKVVIEFDLMEPNSFDAKNGVIIRATSVLPLE